MDKFESVLLKVASVAVMVMLIFIALCVLAMACIGAAAIVSSSWRLLWA